MGQIYETQLNEVDRAIEGYNDVLGIDPNEPRALDALGRLYEKISEWDRAIEMMGELVKQDRRPAQAGRPLLAHGPDPIHPAPRRRGLGIEPATRSCTRRRPRADDGGFDQAVLGSRRLVEGRADDGSRRELHAGRDRQGSPAVRGGQHLRVQDPSRRSGQGPVRRSHRARSGARRSRSSARGPLLQRQAMGRAAAGDRHARPQGRASPHRSEGAQRDLLPRCKDGGRARRLQQGAWLLQASVRYGLDVSADATRPCRPAVQDAGLGQRWKDLPDDPRAASRRSG